MQKKGEQINMTKKALVLAGGGTRGIYQTGVLKALHELGKDDYNMVFGVSVGALNAALIVQKEEDALDDMYDHLTSDQIVKGFVPNDLSLGNIINSRDEFIPQLQYYLKSGGIDISPFYDMVEKFYDPDKFFSSDIDFGAQVALKKDHSAVYVTKDMMKDHGRDWLVASASAYPAFPVKTIDGTEYVDGGYYDNCPVDFALRQGAEEVIAVDLGADPLHHLYLDKPHIRYIHPHKEMFNFLDFDHEKMQAARIAGYNDAMKCYGKYEGELYTFKRFSLPSYFDEYYRGLLILETKIKYATNINERFRSEHVITDRIKEQLHVDHLSTRQYIYGILDVLMAMIGLDDNRVYTLNQARKYILAAFADCAKEDYPYMPGIKPSDIAAYAGTLDRKGTISKIIHSNLYPSHRLFTENMDLTMHPYETAMADFVTIMMRHLPEEKSL